MSAPADFPFASRAALLNAYEANVQSALRWVHPSWLAAALDLDAPAAESLRQALGMAAEGSIARCSLALIRTLADAVPNWVDEPAPRVAWLDAAPIELGMQVLRLRAIVFRRAEMRRLIDKPSRMRLAQWAGVPLESVLGNANGAPDIERMVRDGLLSPQHEMDAESIAQEGYRLVACEVPELADACPLIRLALPREPAGAPRADVFARGQDPRGMGLLTSYLPTWFPEWAWLFG
jgi:type III secretion system HrpB4-like protein